MDIAMYYTVFIKVAPSRGSTAEEELKQNHKKTRSVLEKLSSKNLWAIIMIVQ